MEAKITYHFSAKLWQNSDSGAWVFITVPTKISKEIRENLQWQEEGWGRMKATATIQNLEWKTAIWFDTKADNYLLPIKAEIRKKAKIKVGDEVQISVAL